MLKIFFWGTGCVANTVLSECNVFDQYEILGFIDNSESKIGTKFWGKEIYPAEILKTVKPDKIVILTDYYDEIKTQILSIFPEMCNAIENKNFFYKQIILRRYKDTADDEIKKVLDYINDNGLDVFNYEFAEKYKDLDIEVLFDSSCGMYYVYHKGKKLYFAKSMDTEQKVKNYYKGLLLEQDEESPHKYLTSQFDVEEGDVVVDVGVAEGNFSLEIVDKVSKLYLVEADESWMEALQQTFKEYMDKVVIIKKYITSIDEDEFATLDSIVNEPVDFIKMDIEGNEWDALLGAKELIGKSTKLKCAICSYHRDYDEILIKDVMAKYGMESFVTQGYMWFPYKAMQQNVSTRLCRGVVRGKK